MKQYHAIIDYTKTSIFFFPSFFFYNTPWEKSRQNKQEKEGLETQHDRQPASLMSQPIQVQRGTDTCQMTERLRHVAHLFTRDGNLFREHAQVVGVREDIIEM